MSLRTRIKGYTAWVNLRLMSYNQLLNNVLMDLLQGTGFKNLIESITGRHLNRLESFDGLTQQQKQTRVEWIVEELKKCSVIPKDITIDSRLFAMRSADHVFELMWRLICHDIWFLWERLEYLQHDDEDILTQVPFKWTPDPPPPTKKKKKIVKQSLLSGFGSASVKVEDDGPQEEEDEWVKFPRSDWVKNFKRKKREEGRYPSPDDCIKEMATCQLKKTQEGRILNFSTIDDFVDSRVLCALINSFVPNTFTTDVLLNDRWTINLALRTSEKMFYTETPLSSEDLLEADAMAVCSYFCYFFMVAYKFRQCRAVVNRIDFIGALIRECIHELEMFPSIVSNIDELQRRKELKTDIEKHKQAIEKLERRFDIPYCRKWVLHVEQVQDETRDLVRQQIRLRFDKFSVPRNITINDLSLSYVINLSLTNGSGFYLSESRETMSEGRKLVLRVKATGDYIEDFSSKSKVCVRQILRLPKIGVVEVNPDHYPQYEFYFEATSRNKQLKTGSTFLYQVFPGNTLSWQRMFIKAARENEYEMVERMIMFFRIDPHFINSHEPKTGHTALHWAARNGNFEIVQLLLENGADMDMRNNFRCTPLNMAIEGVQRRTAHLLIEWGCDVHGKNIKRQTPLETVKNEEFKTFLVDLYKHYSDIVPKITDGDMELLNKVVKDHADETRKFCSLRSRCMNGSTILHTACYYGNIQGAKDILQLRVDVNLRDYKGATPLHRAKNTDTLKVLMDAGALIDAEDLEGNTPLHVKCYGETKDQTELDCVELLLMKHASLLKRNNRALLPVHCAAMQGRIDVIKMLMKYDTDERMCRTLGEEDAKKPPSLIHLALANDFMECAQWLLSNGFNFKTTEQDIILKRIITEQVKISDKGDGVRFLLENGADPNPRYPGGNTAMHYAASLLGGSEVIEILLSYGGQIDPINDDGSTPLFFATQTNNHVAACVLLSEGANFRHKNNQGLTSFDHIVDFEEWIETGYFNEEIQARLKAYNLKHARDLIRAISKRVKPNPVLQIRHDLKSAATLNSTNLRSPDGSSSFMRTSQVSMKPGSSFPILPPIK